MDDKDIQNIIDLMKIVRHETVDSQERKEFDLSEFNPMEFRLPEDFNTVRPIVSVDGSYCFLFSFLGAETWIALFRVAITNYEIKIINGEIKYHLRGPLKMVNRFFVLSFREKVLNEQPRAFSLAKKDAEKFRTRKQQIFATDIMTYLEHKTLEKISETYSDCILLADGALVSRKDLYRKPIFDNIIDNCEKNDNWFAGVSKTTSSRFFDKFGFYSDDAFLKKFFDKKYPSLTYIKAPIQDFAAQFQQFHRHGDLYFAKMSENALKWFRVDVGYDGGELENLFSQIAAYSMVHMLPGYPIGLIEAHTGAKSVRKPKLKEMYEMRLIKPLKDIGLEPQEILDGAVDFDGEHWRSFHETLDLWSL